MLVRDLLVALDRDGDTDEVSPSSLLENSKSTLGLLGGNEPSPETRALLAQLLSRGSSPPPSATW